MRRVQSHRKNLREREHLVNLNQDVMGLWITFRGDDVWDCVLLSVGSNGNRMFVSIKHGIPFSSPLVLVSTTSPFILLMSLDGAMTLCGTCGVEERTVACVATHVGHVEQSTTRRAGIIEPEPANFTVHQTDQYWTNFPLAGSALLFAGKGPSVLFQTYNTDGRGVKYFTKYIPHGNVQEFIFGSFVVKRL
jgi:hypothetical protein